MPGTEKGTELLSPAELVYLLRFPSGSPNSRRGSPKTFVPSNWYWDVLAYS
jgi:hypothetical protein